MMDCKLQRGACSAKPAPAPPPCPPPPPKPFPWRYVVALLSLFGLMGLLYNYILYVEERNRIGEFRQIWRPRRKIKRPAQPDDLPPCVEYLIVGAGAAGWAAYRSIMQHDKKAKVFFVTKEDILPYRRPPMSKHMWWNPQPPDPMKLNYLIDARRFTMFQAECKHFMDPVRFYRKEKGPAVSIATGWCVIKVDPEDHIAYILTPCGLHPMYYERCLLAPGAIAKTLSIFKNAPKGVRDKVHTLRNIRDLELTYREVDKAKRVVIIGGGILGSELAWYLGRRNKMREPDRQEDEEPLEIIQLIKDKGLMSKFIPSYLGEWAVEKIACEGVKVVTETQVYDAFETPDGKLELTLSNGNSLITDYVLVAIGTTPQIDIAYPSYLETDKEIGGFSVNSELQARTHLWVAGDAASFYSQWKDHRVRTEHYVNAEEEGFIAGANMAGYFLPCNVEPHFEFTLGDLDIEVVGEVGACMPTVALFKRCWEEEAAEEEARLEAEAAARALLPPEKVKRIRPCMEIGEGQDDAGKETQGNEEELIPGQRPCFNKEDEYFKRYKRGLLFYLREETVVGMMFWNLPPIEDRTAVATELLRAEPSYKDINLLSELVGFPNTAECVWIPPELRNIKIGPCIENRRFF